MKLSIIIPAYNSEKYIKKCILSCLNQDINYSDYEIVVVDDGSTDSTMNLVLSMKEQYGNIQYYYQTNVQGAARNNGLSKAKGKYIWFVDSDDWIAENCLVMILKRLEEDKLTALLVGHATQYLEHLDKWEVLDDAEIVSGKEILLRNKLFISPTYAIWNREYLLSNNLRFMEHVFHEDTEFYPRLFYIAKRIGFLSRICYFVYANPNSTTRGVNPKRSFDMISLMSGLNVYKNRIVESDIRQFLVNYISMNLNAAL